MIQFFNTPSDLSWLAMTHLAHVDIKNFHSFVLVGHESNPDVIQLYVDQDPLYTDHYVVYLKREALIACGVIAKPA